MSNKLLPLLLSLTLSLAHAGPVVVMPSTATGGTSPTLPVVTEGAACTATTTANTGIRADYSSVLICSGSKWVQQGRWKDPVANFASLPSCDAAASGDSRIAITPTVGTGPRPYMCDGAGTWQPLAIDNNGNLSVPGTLGVGTSATLGVIGAVCTSGAVAKNTAGQVLYCDASTLVYRLAAAGTAVANTLQVAGVVVENAACPNGANDNGRVARDVSGLLLSCQSGVWKKAAGGGTGMRGILSPLAGKTISCSTPYVTAYAHVDASGNPFSRAAGLGSDNVWRDTGWVAGFNAYATRTACCLGTIVVASAKWTIAAYPSLAGVDDDQGFASCTANWPAT